MTRGLNYSGRFRILTPRSKTDRSPTGLRASSGLRRGRFSAKTTGPIDWDEVRPAIREEMLPVILASILLAFMALMLSFSRGYVLLYGDAVAHLGIARRILDTRNPGLVQLGGVWLPLPHLLMLPFVQRMEWWQSGLAGAWPSIGCYIAGVAGFYRLCRRMLVPRWALTATAFYAVNPNLLYLATTAMTEPLFLALIIWMTLLTVECIDEIRADRQSGVARRLIGLGLLIFAAVFTRYDGWVLGAAVWCVVTGQLWRVRGMWRRVVPSFAVFTLLALSGPMLWFWYNQHFFHDPLDFMRGPYSAPAIEKKTSPPGSRHYRGWHNPAWALLFYTRTAQVVAAAWETGFALMAAAVAGLWIAWRRRIKPASLLLWVPLAFYVYSVAYGSVPIFIPQLWPHSYYNARYGMELLPALALFACVAAAALELKLKSAAAARVDGIAPEGRRPRWKLLYPTALTLAFVNALAMMYGTTVVQRVVSLVRHRPSHVMAIYDPPLVLKEAIVNA
ncbi:MAG TPA: hypothetical protein VHV99_23155, partial [Paraburkholderia sp.]|nr:hypothetical protein [Paraburkholderia sp.]